MFETMTVSDMKDNYLMNIEGLDMGGLKLARVLLEGRATEADVSIRRLEREVENLYEDTGMIESVSKLNTMMILSSLRERRAMLWQTFLAVEDAIKMLRAEELECECVKCHG